METPIGPMGLRRSLRATPARPRPGGDAAGKLHLLLEYAGRPDEAVADPWYTRDFRAAWDDVTAGCRGLFEKLSDPKTGLYFQSSGYVYSFLIEELDKK